MEDKTEMADKTKKVSESNWLSRELFGLIVIFFGFFLILSLATFDQRDPWFNQVISSKTTKIYNQGGLLGSYTGGLLFDVLGIAAWVIPFYFCFFGVRRILGHKGWPWWRSLGIVLISICLSLAGGARDAQLQQAGTALVATGISNHGGGLLGHFLYSVLVGWLSSTGTLLVWVLTLLLSLQMLVGFSWLQVVLKSASALWKTCLAMVESTDTFQKMRVEKDGEISQQPTVANTAEIKTPQNFALQEELPLIPELIQEMQQEKRAKPRFWHALQQRWNKRAETNAPLTIHEGKEDIPKWVNDFEQNQYGVPKSPASVVRERTPYIDPILLQIMENQNISEEEFTADADSAHNIQEQNLQEQNFQGENTQVENTQGESFHGHVPRDLSNSMEQGQEFIGHTQTSPHTNGLPADTLNQEYADFAEDEYDDTAQGLVAEPVEEVNAAPQDEPIATIAPKNSLVKNLLTRKNPTALPVSTILEAISITKSSTSNAEFEAKGKDLVNCLNDFGIQCELVGITPGPVVTMFELRPAPGVRVSRIANLSDDLALTLKAIAVRVQAPIPGTDTVGIEVPNEVREIVCFKELIQSPIFQNTTMRLPLALGKDISGMPFIADLAGMPHLLMAGATGAGKSVGINSILLSLLFKARPDEVKLLLVDPKRVELAIYADLPHLVHPVVTEMSLAKNALDWAVAEMDTRYSALAKAGVRNIVDYNTKLKECGTNVPEALIGLELMPYLVVVIDELADLMLVGSKEIETSIVRLAQLARAAGIHLILATQRPSVDVVTGLIKANFPCRISFQVTSKHDSRTILDAVGAEYLLGKGDMLFKPPGGRFLRLHGAFVTDTNVNVTCDYWRKRQKPDYRIDFAEFGSANGSEGSNGDDDILNDPLYAEACEYVRQQGKVSISLIQRRFRIGFNKAARFVDQMEFDGIVGPADGSKPRQVLH